MYRSGTGTGTCTPHSGDIDAKSPNMSGPWHLRDEKLREQLCDATGLTEQKIDGVLAMFLEDVQSEKGMEKWPLKYPSYSISKMALYAYTRLLALELGDKTCVNSVHPGYVITDMTFGTSDFSLAEGAANLVRIALLPAGGPSGHNFLERKDADF
ncbi:(+)-neomenthol dehydrogenase-like [Nymphaea colorata]|nr:(+)-neomenthol dehydrogenase-like [Nymphaea colorata]